MPPDELLPEPLPDDPMPLFMAWFNAARERAAQPNPDAMVLATAGADGAVSARVVLCKRLVASPGYVVFFTNYESRKARDLAERPRAAAVFHWDTLQRQVRIEGAILRSPTPESDEYFASRALESRLGAWASRQSQPLASRAELTTKVRETAQRFGALSTTQVAAEVEVPRPPHWGGYRLWIDAIELWAEGAGRIHDRARWTRALTPQGPFTYAVGAWQGTRLNP